jgi:opacity protein-like surface antigen
MRKMKKLIIASALSAAFVSPTVFAQATGFTGFYGQVGLGMNSAGSNVNASLQAPDPEDSISSSGKLGQQNIAGNVAFGYNYGLTNGLNIGANVFYNIASDAAGSLSSNSDGDALNISQRLKNIWGISVEPGYSFSDNSLGYMKLGWAQAQSSLTLTADGSLPVSLGTTNGFLYGVGFKQAINKNVYVGIELYQIAFGKKNTTRIADSTNVSVSSTPTYTYGGIVLGARF